MTRTHHRAPIALVSSLLVVLSLVFVGLTPARTQADEHPTFPVSRAALRSAKPETIQVNQALRALDRLARYGYTVNTATRADRAIRHWQRVNGLVVDGIIGPQTLASLGIADPATASVPAVRQTPPAPAPPGDVEQIIRDVWPDDLEDHAVAIARRESNLQPGVRNACCFGLFQIHWTANRATLADLGISSSSELFDARTNAEAALVLFQRSGWAPWRCGGALGCREIP